MRGTGVPWRGGMYAGFDLETLDIPTIPKEEASLMSGISNQDPMCPHVRRGSLDTAFVSVW